MACNGGTLKSGDNKYYPNAYYKVGDLFLTTNSENPSIRFGGVWELFGKGKTLVCVDTDDTDFNAVKKTGGEKTHTLTIDEIPSHQHNIIRTDGGKFKGAWDTSPNGQNTGLISTMGKNEYASYVAEATGGDKPHNNLQPYITCYIWIRTK